MPHAFGHKWARDLAQGFTLLWLFFDRLPDLRLGDITSCPISLGMEGIYLGVGKLSIVMEMESFLGVP